MVYALGTGCHPGSETSVGLQGEQKLCVRRSHVRPEPHHDELHTFRRETEPRRHCRNEGWIRAVAESHCRHDMMMMDICSLVIFLYTLLYFTLLYFTLVGVVSSDVSRSSRTTSLPPCCSIFSQSHVFFQGCICPLLDVINVLHPGAPPSSFPRHHSENASLYKIVSACMSK